MPPPKALPGTDIVVPHVVLGDEAFPLLENLMKPYSRQDSAEDQSLAIFNYRLSRGRRYVENAFGILSQTFRIFLTPIYLDVETCEHLVTDACIIHNLIRDENQSDVEENSLTPECGFQPISISEDITERLLQPEHSNYVICSKFALFIRNR